MEETFCDSENNDSIATPSSNTLVAVENSNANLVANRTINNADNNYDDDKKQSATINFAEDLDSYMEERKNHAYMYTVQRIGFRNLFNNEIEVTRWFMTTELFDGESFERINREHLSGMPYLCYQQTTIADNHVFQFGYADYTRKNYFRYWNWSRLQWINLNIPKDPLSVYNMVSIDTSDTTIYVNSGYRKKGDRQDNRIYCYNKMTGNWNIVPENTNPVNGCSLVTCDNVLYVCGGHNHAVDFASRKVFSHDPRSNVRWTKRASMPVETACAGATELNGKLYVCGGTRNRLHGENNFSANNMAFEYEPRADKWRMLKSMRIPRWSYHLMPYKDKIWAFGGSHEVEHCESYDPKIGHWQLELDLLIRKDTVVSSVVF